MGRRSQSEAGQTMAEYSLVLAIITLATLGAFGLFSTNIEALLARAADLLGG